METQLDTSNSSFVYQRIPTKVSRKDFKRYIDPHLKRPKTGPKPKLSLYKIFHIPTDLVVAQEASDMESSSRLDFLLLYSLRRRFID